ncbi:DUF4124 domain-containing protein [Pseudoteredinibacter isoporae]|uniref:DUF4124 domain-containing protein n=1 Tax=Pseudoteredinibacter isoporae TaxID=570281 RepID=A0A7X0JSN2_9GAMM|nr:DUF4124 domain-containing protein [Pseudoteredinibacter isoporae]MBB6520943.1 hypothetical protein [Pseudoteredinibacter isoporae]NHO86508.1 DUF4124 domain-containing protein [Pseudoteredinibacter isoporae]NIB25040.1 DUF4124 domain-containing protein [Pseudoteredinibacter isoporae]
MRLKPSRIRTSIQGTVTYYGFIVILSLFALPAFSAMYTWVDEAGRRHYSDKVPPKYKSQASLVGGNKTNVMKSTEVRERNREMVQQVSKQTVQRSNKSKSANRPVSAEEYAQMSCRQKWQAFRNSEQCYSMCADSETVYGARKWRNVAQCGHCSDVKKPLCKEE